MSALCIKGLYLDNIILLDSNIETIAEKTFLLAEEIGHYITTTSNILDQKIVENEKQEEKARRWAVDSLLEPSDFVDAFEKGVRNRFELAEYLNVTEEFIDYSIIHFQKKYGMYIKVDTYTVFFEPLGVFKEL